MDANRRESNADWCKSCEDWENFWREIPLLNFYFREIRVHSCPFAVERIHI